MIDYIISRLQEPSTWRGLIGIVTAAGLAVSPALAVPIIAIGTAAAGAINVLRKETTR